MSKFLSGRIKELLLGVVGRTEDKTVLQTTGTVGIGTTNSVDYTLYVNGSTNIDGGLTVGSASTFSDNVNIDETLNVVGVATFQNDVYVDQQLYVAGLQIIGGATVGEDILARNLKLTGIATVTGLTDLNGDFNVAGVSTFQDRAIFDSTNSIQIPVGTEAQKDAVGVAVTGQVRFNTTNQQFEGFGVGNNWGSLGGVKDVDGDTEIKAELSAGSDEDNLYFYNGGYLSATISSEAFTVNVPISLGYNLEVTGIATVSGDFDVDGDTKLDNLNVSGVSTFSSNVSFSSDIDSHLIPASDDTYDLGASNDQWRNLYIDGLADVDQLLCSGNADFSSNVEIGGDLNIADKIVHTGDTNTAIRFPAADTFTVETAGSERLRIDSNGDVGVGITDPQERLHVARTAMITGNTPQIRLNANDSDADDADRTMLGQATSAGNFVTTAVDNDTILRGTATGNLLFGVGTAEKFRITSDGKFGFGTNTVSDFVDILYGQDADNIVMVRGADNTSEYAAVGINGGNAVITGGGVGSTSAGIVFRTAASGTEVERLRITSGGDVSIKNDSGKFTAGTDDDLKIYHDGSNSYVEDTGTGALIMKGSALLFKSTTNENIINASQNGSVDLFYDDSKKFATTGIGVSVVNGTSDTATIAGPSNLIIDPGTVGDNTGIVRIKGDLFVDGTTTQINSTSLEIADFVVGIASTATTDLLADGAGIQIGPDNTLLYEHNGGTNPSLKSSENLNVATGKGYQVNQVEILNATTLGSSVVNSSLTSVGTLGSLTVSGDISIADKIIHTGDTNTAIRFPTDDNFTVETAGTEALRVDGDQRVGLGTDDLQAHFTVYGSDNSAYTREIRIDASDAPSGANGHGVYRILGDGNSLGKYIIAYNSTHPSQPNDVSLKNSDGDISFYNATNSTPTEKLRITTTGRVGINSRSPNYTLDLGESASTIRLVSENNGTALRVGAGGDSNDVTLIRVDGDSQGSNFNGESDSARFGFSIKYMGSRNSNNNSLSIFSDNLQGTQVEAVTVLQDGIVGINSTIPSERLDVAGTTKTEQLNVTGIATVNHIDVNSISPDGSDTGSPQYLLKAVGDGTWEWANVPGIFSVNNILNGFTVKEEGVVVGTAGSITTLDFRGSNVIVSADPHPNGIATVTFTQNPVFSNLDVTGISTLAGITSVTGSTLFTKQLSVSGVSTFYGDVTLSGSSTDLVVGGTIRTSNLHSNGTALTIRGGGNTSTRPAILLPQNDTGDINIQGYDGGSGDIVVDTRGSGDILLKHNGTTQITIDSGGSSLAGIVTVTGSTLFAKQLSVSGIATFSNAVSTGGTTGTNGQYLKSTGIGVTWASFPTLRTTQTSSAVNGQTTFNFTYNVNFLDVFINGVKLTSSEYTASNGTSVVLATPAFESDIIEFHSYNTTSTGSAGGGASNLNGLSDVTISSLADDHILQYNSSTNVFENVAAPYATTASVGLATTGLASEVFVGLATTGLASEVFVGLATAGLLTATGDASNLTGLTGASANTYGNSTAVPQIVVDSNGKITSISNVLISGGGGGGTSIIVQDSQSLVGTAGTIDFGTGLSVSPVSSGIVTVTATQSNNFTGNVTITSTDTGSSAAPEFKLYRNSASPADADYLGQIKFAGESDTGVERNYAKITGKILDASNGTEDGIIEFAHIRAGSQTITGRWRSDSLQLLNGTNLSVNGTISGNGSGITNLSSSALTGALPAIDGSALTGITTTTAEWTLGANGSSDYTFTGPGVADGAQDPTIYLVRGQTYKFKNRSGGHPFRIQYEFQNTGGTAYSDGIINNSANHDTDLYWEVRNDAPDLLHYQCTSHTSMSGRIVILGDVVANGSWTASAGTAQTIDTITGVANNAIKTAEYVIHIENGSNMQAQKVLVMQDGTTAFSQEYAIMHKSGLLVSMSATISGGNLLLQATPETGITGNTTFRFTRQTIR